MGRPAPAQIAYSWLLTATAGTACWYDSRSGLAGALFVISDTLIGAQLAGHDFPTRPPLVGLAYTAGQYNLQEGS